MVKYHLPMQETRVRSLIWEDAAEQLSPLSSVQLLSRVRLFANSWTVARQASLSITNSQSLLKLMPIESVMPSDHLVLCRPLLLVPSIFSSIRVFSSDAIRPSHPLIPFSSLPVAQLSLCAIAIEPVLRVREPKVLSPHVATTALRP